MRTGIAAKRLPITVEVFAEKKNPADSAEIGTVMEKRKNCGGFLANAGVEQKLVRD